MLYVDMIADGDIDASDKAFVLKRAQDAVNDFEERSPGAKNKLIRILQVMLYAHSASKLRDSAREILASLQ